MFNQITSGCRRSDWTGINMHHFRSCIDGISLFKIITTNFVTTYQVTSNIEKVKRAREDSYAWNGQSTNLPQPSDT